MAAAHSTANVKRESVSEVIVLSPTVPSANQLARHVLHPTLRF